MEEGTELRQVKLKEEDAEELKKKADGCPVEDEKENAKPTLREEDYVYRIREMEAVNENAEEPLIYDITYNAEFFKDILSEEEWLDIMNTANDIWRPAGTSH